MFLDLDILNDADRDPVENPELTEKVSEKKQWRSFADRDSESAWKADAASEFLPGATEGAPDNRSRRSFLQVMSASVAMAGLAACRRPVEKILPYTRQPEEIIPGKPLYYASAMPFAGSVRPILVESHEGRPTKIEGNPEHPYNAGVGATGIFEQATILAMFDPDRTQVPMKDGVRSDWKTFRDECRTLVQDAANKRVVVLAPTSSSPTLNSLAAAFRAKYPNGQWIAYDAEGEDVQSLGMQIAFGTAYRPHYKFADASVIVSLDSDFLSHTDPNSVHNSREFAAGRRVHSTADSMSRFYAVESGFTITGGMADHRLKLRSSEITGFAAALAARLGIADAASVGAAYADHPWVSTLANELQSNQGSGIVLAGNHQPAEVHALCGLINQALGNIGTTVQLLDTGSTEPLVPQNQSLASLVEAMNGGQVDALLMLGVNPVYSAPSDLNFAEAIGNVTWTAHAGLLQDETGATTDWHLPLSHFLEAWSDGRAFDGTLSIIQPLIAPLYDSKSELELVHLLTEGTEGNGYDLVRQQWATVTPDEKAWSVALHDGFLADSAFSTVESVSAQPMGDVLSLSNRTGSGEVEVVFRLHSSVYDGSFANVSWLQELPDTVTKVVWDNVAAMGPATAEKLGIGYTYSSGNYQVDTVRITVGDNSIEIPAWIVPGVADDTVVVNLGYGRNITSQRDIRDIHFYDIDTDIYNMNGGPLANGVGTSVEKLRTTGNWNFVPARVEKVGDRNYTLVTTQDHGSLDWGDSLGAIAAQESRDIIRTATLEEYKEDAHVIKEQRENKLATADEPFSEYPELWKNQHPKNDPHTTESIYYQYQWGMAIDLNACTGCNACVVACQSENNIQVVGKHEVGRGREMHWIRIDRYFQGDKENPKMLVQPLMCVHCENAPCEAVCPVAATSHSPDGINEMTYNRCIGTRYCANNCPYKVRRFNYFNWTRDLPNSVRMTQNPDVTVRFRGVMEKCTFCVQRVRKAGIEARNHGRAIQEGEVVTACQQVCPTQAISFGNLKDESSAVVAHKENDRNYELLAELGVKPRTSFLGRLFNPNPEIESAG